MSTPEQETQPEFGTTEKSLAWSSLKKYVRERGLIITRGGVALGSIGLGVWGSAELGTNNLAAPVPALLGVTVACVMKFCLAPYEPEPEGREELLAIPSTIIETEGFVSSDFTPATIYDLVFKNPLAMEPLPMPVYPEQQTVNQQTA